MLKVNPQSGSYKDTQVLKQEFSSTFVVAYQLPKPYHTDPNNELRI